MTLAETPSSAPFAIPAMQSTVLIPNSVLENHGPMDGSCLVHTRVSPIHPVPFVPCCSWSHFFTPPVPPQITAGPNPLTVVVNEPVMLECDATGTPPPVLLWLKDGNPVPSMVAGGPEVRQFLMDGGLTGDVPPG